MVWWWVTGSVCVCVCVWAIPQWVWWFLIFLQWFWTVLFCYDWFLDDFWWFDDACWMVWWWVTGSVCVCVCVCVCVWATPQWVWWWLAGPCSRLSRSCTIKLSRHISLPNINPRPNRWVSITGNQLAVVNFQQDFEANINEIIVYMNLRHSYKWNHFLRCQRRFWYRLWRKGQRAWPCGEKQNIICSPEVSISQHNPLCLWIQVYQNKPHYRHGGKPKISPRNCFCFLTTE